MTKSLLIEIYTERYGLLNSDAPDYWLNLEELAIELFELLPPKLRRNKKTWGKRHLHNVLTEAYKTSKPLMVAMTNFAAIYFDDTDPAIARLSKRFVYSANGLKPGSVILGHSVQCAICRKWFVPRSETREDVNRYCDDCRPKARQWRQKQQQSI